MPEVLIAGWPQRGATTESPAKRLLVGTRISMPDPDLDANRAHRHQRLSRSRAAGPAEPGARVAGARCPASIFRRHSIAESGPNAAIWRSDIACDRRAFAGGAAGPTVPAPA